MARPRREALELMVKILAAAGGVTLSDRADVMPYSPAVMAAMAKGDG